MRSANRIEALIWLGHLFRQTFYMASRLSEDGVAALRLKGGSGEEDPTRREQVFTRSTQHLAPDTDSCAAAIEGLFACGAQDAAELNLVRSHSDLEILP